MTLSRQVLRKIDDVLRSEFDEEKGEWIAKVPISGATNAVWQRYCQAAGVGMGEGVALLMLHELASVAGEDAETLADRLHTQSTRTATSLLINPVEEPAQLPDPAPLSERVADLRLRGRWLPLRHPDLWARERGC